MARWSVSGLAVAVFVSALVAGGCSRQAPAAPSPTPSAPELASLASPQGAPARNSTVDIVPFYGDAAGHHLTPTGDPATPIYRVSNPGGPVGPFPVIAPDGHHVTLGEWVNITGSASADCITQGTHIVVHLSGLLPKAVYSVWLIVPNPAPTPGFAGVGAAGTSDGTENVFHTSASGEGESSTITPAGPLSFIPGKFPACGLDLPEFHVVTAYHIDQRTWGPVPGNGPATFLEQGAFVFKH
jgi:hypothetical protein